MTDTPVDGTWDLVVNTPIGKQQALLILAAQDGVLRGVARDPRDGQEYTLTDLELDGNRLRWGQSITKPMRLDITFDVTVDGEHMTGRAKAGRLPAATVSGHRIASDSPPAGE